MGSLKFQTFKNALFATKMKRYTLAKAINRRENPLFKPNP